MVGLGSVRLAALKCARERDPHCCWLLGDACIVPDLHMIAPLIKLRVGPNYLVSPGPSLAETQESFAEQPTLEPEVSLVIASEGKSEPNWLGLKSTVDIHTLILS